MVKTYGFPVKIFPKKPIHQRIFHPPISPSPQLAVALPLAPRGHWRFPGWWIISAEGLGLIGDSKSSWEKRARSHRQTLGNIEKNVQKAMETEWFRERVYNWWMFMDFPHRTLSLLESKYHKIVIYQLNNGILTLQSWDLAMKNWDSKFHPMSWVSSCYVYFYLRIYRSHVFLEIGFRPHVQIIHPWNPWILEYLRPLNCL